MWCIYLKYIKCITLVYPNPTNGTLNIKAITDLNFNSVDIIDLNGTLINSILLNNKEGTINLNELPDGIYLIKIHSDVGVVVKKVIKI